MIEKLLLRPEEAAQALGIGRSTVYEAIRTGVLESIKVGRCRRVPMEAVRIYVEQLRQDRLGEECGRSNPRNPHQMPRRLRNMPNSHCTERNSQRSGDGCILETGRE